MELVEVVIEWNVARKIVRTQKGSFSTMTDSAEVKVECKVCFDREVNVTVGKCGHRLCTECFVAWGKRHEGCPFCRRRMNGIAEPTLARELGLWDAVDWWMRVMPTPLVVFMAALVVFLCFFQYFFLAALTIVAESDVPTRLIGATPRSVKVFVCGFFIGFVFVIVLVAVIMALNGTTWSPYCDASTHRIVRIHAVYECDDYSETFVNGKCMGSTCSGWHMV